MKKILFLAVMLLFSSCSTYQASMSADGSKVAVAYNNTFSWIFSPKVYVCDVHKHKLVNCETSDPDGSGIKSVIDSGKADYLKSKKL